MKGGPYTLADKQVRFHSERQFKYGRLGHRMLSGLKMKRSFVGDGAAFG
jgi:hypothetical protein